LITEYFDYCFTEIRPGQSKEAEDPPTTPDSKRQGELKFVDIVTTLFSRFDLNIAQCNSLWVCLTRNSRLFVRRACMVHIATRCLGKSPVLACIASGLNLSTVGYGLIALELRSHDSCVYGCISNMSQFTKGHKL